MKFDVEFRLVVNPQRGHGLVHRFTRDAAKAMGCKTTRGSTAPVTDTSHAYERCGRCERSFVIRSRAIDLALVQRLARDLRGVNVAIAQDAVLELIDACLPETCPAPWEAARG